MRILLTKNVSTNIKSGSKRVFNKVPKKVTVENLPYFAGTIGMLSPIPFAGPTFFIIGKIAQIFLKIFNKDKKTNLDKVA